MDHKYILIHLCHKNMVCFTGLLLGHGPGCLCAKSGLPTSCHTVPGRGAGVPTLRLGSTPHTSPKLFLGGNSQPAPLAGPRGGGWGQKRQRMTPPLPQVRTCP